MCFQHKNWHSRFKKFCIKTEFLECDGAVLNYLKSDKTIKLPNQQQGFKKRL